MSVDYNNFAKTFSQSRKNMSWPELEYFFEKMQKEGSILDIWCWNGRLREQYYASFEKYPPNYIGVDLSQELLSEAQKLHKDAKFIHADMRDVSSMLAWKSFENLFLIASFHHLDSLGDRKDFLASLHTLSEKNTKIYMTNWHLLSEKNIKKYKTSQVSGSENEFGSCDFQIKIGEHSRYYHSFSLKELEYLAKETSWKIEENRVFPGEKNSITILSKGL